MVMNESQRTEKNVQEVIRTRLENERRDRNDRKRWIIGTGLLLLLIFLLFRVFLGIAVVEGSSMISSYQDSDLVLFTRIYSALERGDVVLARSDDGRVLIKRVIGLPGEEVYIDERTGVIMVDGEELIEEYAQGVTQRGVIDEYPITLGEEEFFLMGDSREASMDSRDFGSVSSDDIGGEVLAILRKNWLTGS